MNTGNNYQKGNNYSRGENMQFNKNVTGKVCTYYGKQNHTVDTCYRKHGFPPGFKFRNSGPFANQVSAEEVTDPFDNTESIQVANSSNSPSMPFTQEQI